MLMPAEAMQEMARARAPGRSSMSVTAKSAARCLVMRPPLMRGGCYHRNGHSPRRRLFHRGVGRRDADFSTEGSGLFQLSTYQISSSTRKEQLLHQQTGVLPSAAERN